MNSPPRRRAGLVLAAVSLAAGLTACGTASGAGSPGPHTSRGGEVKIGLLLPDNRTARYAQFDKPLIEQKIKQLCANCTVEYANAENDVAAQHQQVDAMIAGGADILILDSVDPRSMRSSVVQAHAAGIPVVAYDRLTDGPVSAYVTFAPEETGRLQGQALLAALSGKAHNGAQVVVLNAASAAGPDARADAVRSVLKGKVAIGRQYAVASLSAEEAASRMSAAIAALGTGRIAGVSTVNDTVAAGAISALKAAHIKPLPPVTGQDAELAAVQRIVRGDQYMTVYKPYRPEADAAAEMAVALSRGESLRGITNDTVSSSTTKDIPSVLLTPLPLTVHDIRSTVVKDGVYTIDQICTHRFVPACQKAGLIPNGR